MHFELFKCFSFGFDIDLLWSSTIGPGSSLEPILKDLLLYLGERERDNMHMCVRCGAEGENLKETVLSVEPQ